MTNKILYFAGGSVLTLALVASGTAFAASNGSVGQWFHLGFGAVGPHSFSFENHEATASPSGSPSVSPSPKPAVVGKVTAINGSTITVTAKSWDQNSKATTSTTYTVDASSATFSKGMGAKAQTITASDIQVGDMIIVKGTVSGTSVTATSVNDMGAAPAKAGDDEGTEQAEGQGEHNHDARPVFGTVSAVNGNTITVAETNPKDNTTTTYIVDASSATVMKASTGSAPSQASVSDIKVGDNVIVKGTISGTSVTAIKIFDGPFPTAPGERGESGEHEGLGIHLGLGASSNFHIGSESDD